jgi:hypothetical protein
MSLDVAYIKKTIVGFMKENKKAIEADPCNMPKFKLLGPTSNTHCVNIDLNALATLVKLLNLIDNEDPLKEINEEKP